MSVAKGTNILMDREYAGKTWMTGNMAQLTVFLTGLVLAITAYAVLNILIQQMIREDAHRLVADTQLSVADTLVRFEDTISTAATIVGYSADRPEKELRERLLSSVTGMSDFDNVFWIKPDGTGGWQKVSILTNGTKSFSDNMLKSLAHAIMAQQEKNGEDLVVISDPPGTKEWQELNNPVVRARPFVLSKMIINGKGRDAGMIVGLGRASQMLENSRLLDKSSMSRIVIRDTETWLTLYYMNRNLSEGADVDVNVSGENFAFQIGDSNWQINVLAGPDDRADFLAKMPWLMLVFGITLTLIGTLYVRNNQNQSYKLAIMNRELAQKNYELNSEISERERLNQAVRKAEREYRAIIDAVSDIIFETAVDGEILFLNDTWMKVTGFEIEQSTGLNLFDLLHPQDQEEQRTTFNMLVKGKKSAYRTFTRLRSSDGSFRSVELAVSMLRQDENRNMRVVGTFTDIEERRRAEKALSEAEKKYRTIVENAAGGIYQVTPEGQFLSANPAMARILGYDNTDQMLREIRNAHDNLYVNVRERATFIRDLETLGFVQNFETQVKTRSGARIWVNENARAVKDDDGNILYYEGSMEDISSRKQAEINLHEAKIESDLANRAKSEFLTNMSHELRTPLNAIIGFSEVIKDELLGPLDNKQYWDYARDIHESGQKLLTIINEILDVSRIETGDRQINESIVDLDKVIKSGIDFVAQKADASELVINNMTDGKIPKVVGEELALKQIIVNLLGNAVKYTPSEGRITISHEIESDGRLRISITDTGIGMEEHEIEKALSPFGQIETSLSRSGSGAGLGLTLVEALVKLHEGELDIFSQKGIGTTVTFIIPAKRVRAEKDEDTKAAEGRNAGENGSSTHQIH